MIRKNLRWMAAVILAVNLTVAMPGTLMAQSQGQGNQGIADNLTTTPIKHVVVIFQENVSFDHYFGTYPNAELIEGGPDFHAKNNTPAVNGITEGLIAQNPNMPSAPFRLDRSQNYTCDQNHDYDKEQQAFDSGLMDKFPESVGTACDAKTYPNLAPLGTSIVMGYYDGGTVTGLWNYAQNFAMNDNFFDTNFGPSTPGAINVVSGLTGNADLTNSIDDSSGDLENDVVNGSVIGDPDPFYDDCGSPDQTSLTGNNIGILLNQRNVSWAWFQGGFKPSATMNGKAQCNTKTNRLDGTPETAYSAHHDPFQYYAATANIHHTDPAGLSEIGKDGPANHQYDLAWFWQAVGQNQLPAVTYLKANRAQDGHPNNSSPLDEQFFIVQVLNALQQSTLWKSTAVFIAWDDSDGWYDHVMGPIVNTSASKSDFLTGQGMCGTGANSLAGQQSRCGYGPRLPFLLVSSFARENFVDHTVTDQSSVVRFIEDNWDLGRIGPGSFDAIAGPLTNMFDFKHPRKDVLILDPLTGEAVGNFGSSKKMGIRVSTASSAAVIRSAKER